MSDDKITGAMLTPTQREFLREGPDEGTSKAAARMTRGRIEERIGIALSEDAPLVADGVEDSTLDPARIAESLEPGEVAEGIRTMVSFLYRLGDAAGVNPEKAIEDGMNEARGERLQRILEKFETNEAATVPPDELKMLNDHGYLGDDFHEQLFKIWLGAQGHITVSDVREVTGRDEWK